MSSNIFCLKICDPCQSKPAGLCQHTLDESGCAYNASSKYTVGPIASPELFETCESDDMGIPGEDPKWDIFAELHAYLESRFPLV